MNGLPLWNRSIGWFLELFYVFEWVSAGGSIHHQGPYYTDLLMYF